LNVLDIILVGVIISFGLLGKYSGFNLQLNKFISLILSIITTKVALIKLIIFFIPYIGLSSYTKPIVYFLSISGFYIIFKLLINIFLFRYEKSRKNKIIQIIMGTLFGMLNGLLLLAVILSILFYSITLKDDVIEKLKYSTVFNYIHSIKTTLVDYER
tara:strand:- start:141 stop:614 length:474 start_codon:yes stop_codon:yes gene_type:complete